MANVLEPRRAREQFWAVQFALGLTICTDRLSAGERSCLRKPLSNRSYAGPIKQTHFLSWLLISSATSRRRSTPKCGRQ